MQRPSGGLEQHTAPAVLGTHSTASLPQPPLQANLGSSPQAPAFTAATQPWQQLSGPVSPALRPVARQPSLPSRPPSPLLLSGSSSPAAAAPGDGLWAVPPAMLAAQLAPSLPFYNCSQVAAQCEAERQLTLLQQLKSSMVVAGSAPASSFGAPNSVLCSWGGCTRGQELEQQLRWLPGQC